MHHVECSKSFKSDHHEAPPRPVESPALLWPPLKRVASDASDRESSRDHDRVMPLSRLKTATASESGLLPGSSHGSMSVLLGGMEAARAKLQGRGVSKNLIGVIDSPAPKTRLEAWSDELYQSNAVVPIRIQVHLIDLKDIDTVKESFNAHTWIQMKWHESLPDGVDFTKTQNKDALAALGVGKWKPALTFLGIGECLVFIPWYHA